LSYREGSERDIEIAGTSQRVSGIKEKFKEGGLL
jgi:hypothetical protein